jgi:hypothetical protein
VPGSRRNLISASPEMKSKVKALAEHPDLPDQAPAPCANASHGKETAIRGAAESSRVSLMPSQTQSTCEALEHQ